MELLPEGWITSEQARELTGYNSEHLQRLARQGAFEAEKVGRTWLFNRDSLLKYHETARPGRKEHK